MAWLTALAISKALGADTEENLTNEISFVESTVEYSSKIYLGFHRGELFLRLAGDIAIVPLANPWNLLSFMVISNFIRELSHYSVYWFELAKWYLRLSDQLANRIATDCQPRRVQLDHPVLKGQLHIESGCDQTRTPFWKFRNAPGIPRLEQASHLDFLDSSALYQLWRRLDSGDWKYLLVQPWLRRQTTGFSIQGCRTDNSCHSLSIPLRLASTDSASWLLHQITNVEAVKPKVISILDENILNLINDSLFCLSLKSRPDQVDSPECPGQLSIVNGTHWQFTDSFAKEYKLSDWLYDQNDFRLLPLAALRKSDKKDWYQCSSYLLWGTRQSRKAPMGANAPEPVLRIAFDEEPRNYLTEYFRYPALVSSLPLGRANSGYLLERPNQAEAAVSSWQYFVHYLFSAEPPPPLPSDLSEEILVATKASLCFPYSSFSGVEKNWPDHPLHHSMDRPVQVPIEHPGSTSSTVNTDTQTKETGSSSSASPAPTPTNVVDKENQDGDENTPPPPEDSLLTHDSSPAGINWQDLLEQLLKERGLRPFNKVIEPDITQLIRDGYPDFTESHAQLRNRWIARITSEKGRPQAYQLLSNLQHHFSPSNKGLMSAITRLAGRNLIIFTALQPGQHTFHFNQSGNGVLWSGPVSGWDENICKAHIYLMYIRGKGFMRLYRREEQSPFDRLPTSDTGLRTESSPQSSASGQQELEKKPFNPYLASAHPTTPYDLPVFLPGLQGLQHSWQEAGSAYSGDAFKSRTLQLFNGPVSAISSNPEFEQLLNRLAQAGLVSFSIVNEKEATPRFRASKTLMEGIEGFWSVYKNLPQELGIEVPASQHLPEPGRTLLDDLIIKSTKSRNNYSLGEIDVDTFTPAYYINVAVPSMQVLVITQYQILTTIASEINKLSPTENQEPNVFVYGGQSIRAHIVEQAFAGNLQHAVEAGLPTVNDLDLRVRNKDWSERMTELIQRSIHDQLPWLTTEPTPLPGTPEGVHTTIIKILWQNRRVYNIDLTYGGPSEQTRFDLAISKSLQLAVAPDLTANIVLPMQDFSTTLAELIKSSQLKTDKDDSFRRRYKAKKQLWLFYYYNPDLKQAIDNLNILPDNWDQAVEEFIFPAEQVAMKETAPEPIDLHDSSEGDKSDKSEVLSQASLPTEPLMLSEYNSQSEEEQEPVIDPEELARRKELYKAKKRERSKKRKGKGKPSTAKKKTAPAPKTFQDTSQNTRTAQNSVATLVTESLIAIEPSITSPELKVSTTIGPTPTSTPQEKNDRDTNQMKTAPGPKTSLEPAPAAPFTGTPDTATSKGTNRKKTTVTKKKSAKEVATPPDIAPASDIELTPKLFAQRRQQLTRMQNEIKPPKRPGIPLTRLSQLDTRAGKLEKASWLYEWTDASISISHHDWVVQSQPLSLQALLCTYKTLQLLSATISENNLFIPAQPISGPAALQLEEAVELGNPIAMYYYAASRTTDSSSGAFTNDALLARAALAYRPARLLQAERRSNPDSDSFDPRGLVNIFHLALKHPDTASAMLYPSMPGISDRALAIETALNILYRPAPGSRIEAASWLLAVIHQNNEDMQYGPYHPGVVGVMLAAGLEEFLPEDWQQGCKQGNFLYDWVCSQSQSSEANDSGPQLTWLPGWWAEELTRVSSSNQALWQCFNLISNTNLFISTLYSGDLIGNQPIWTQLLQILRQKTLPAEKASTDGIDKAIRSFEEKKQALATIITIHDPTQLLLYFQLVTPGSAGTINMMARLAEITRGPASADNYEKAQCARGLIKKLYPEFYRRVIWEPGNQKAPPLTHPGQLGLHLKPIILDQRERSLTYHPIHGHPDNESLGSRLLFMALASAHASVTADGKKVFVSQDALQSTGVHYALRKSACLGNPEANWLLYQANCPEEQSIRQAYLKIAAQGLVEARQLAAIYQSRPGSILFDPMSIKTFYHSTSKPRASRDARVYRGSGIEVPAEKTLDNYYMDVYSRQPPLLGLGQATRKLKIEEAISRGKVNLASPELVAVLTTGGLDAINPSPRSNIERTLQQPATIDWAHAQYLRAIRLGVEKHKAVSYLKDRIGIPFSVNGLIIFHETGQVMHFQKLLAYARLLVIDRSAWPAFINDLNKLVAAGYSQRAWSLLIHILHQDNFLRNPELVNEMANELYQVNPFLGLLAFELASTWKPEFYPVYLKAHIKLLSQHWISGNKKDIKLFPVSKVYNILKLSEDTRLSQQARASFQDVCKELRNCKHPVVQYTYHTASQLAPESLNSSIDDDGSGFEQYNQYLLRTLNWLLARVESPEQLQQQPIPALLDLIRYRQLYSGVHQYLTRIRQLGVPLTSDTYSLLYPASLRHPPSIKLLLDWLMETKSDQLSAVDIYRLRLAAWVTFNMVGPRDQGEKQEWRQDLEQVPVLDVIIDPTLPDSLKEKPLENYDEPLRSLVATIAFIEQMERYLRAIYSDDAKEQTQAEHYKAEMSQLLATMLRLDMTGTYTFFSSFSQPATPDHTLQQLFSHDERALIYTSHMLMATDDSRPAAAQILINELIEQVGIDHQYELGQRLAWNPMLQQSFQYIKELVEFLEENNLPAAAKSLYQGTQLWEYRRNLDSYLTMLAEGAIPFALRHPQQFGLFLFDTTEHYLALQQERCKINQENAEVRLNVCAEVEKVSVLFNLSSADLDIVKFKTLFEKYGFPFGKCTSWYVDFTQ